MKDDMIYLEHILKQIEKIQFSTSIKRKEFLDDIDVQDATMRRLEIIGEAAKNISSSIKKKYPQVEWRKISGARDVLIHAYFSVDLDLVWDIVKKDLPKLKKQLKEIITAIKENEKE